MSTRFTTNSLATADHQRRFIEIVGEDNFFINKPLSEVGHLGLGGVAEYYVRATTSQQLVEIAKTAIELKIPYQLFSAGTGVLPSDVGFPGLIIENCASSFFFSDESRQVVVDSGVNNTELVMAAANRNLGGIEFIVAIPGSVGGAIATSATFMDKTLRNQCLKEIVVFIPNVSGGEVMTVPSQEIEDKPYVKIFSSTEGFQPIILTARLQLARLSQYEILGRLRKLKREANHRSHLGDIFLPPLESIRGVQLPKPPEGLNYSQKSPNEISINVSKGIKSDQVRQYIELLLETYRNAGITLDVRLTYLGYWPKDNETNSSNTESF